MSNDSLLDGSLRRYSQDTGSLCLYQGKLPPPKHDELSFCFLTHPLKDEDAFLLTDNPKLRLFQKKGAGFFKTCLLGALQQLRQLHGPLVYGAFEIRARRRIAYGVPILVPYLPEHYLDVSMRAEVLGAIEAAALSGYHMGARVIGMGAFNSIVTSNGQWLEDRFHKLGIKDAIFTSGSSGTVHFLVEAVVNACSKQHINIPMSQATLMFIGATGSVGRPACELLARDFGRTILSARNEAQLRQMRRRLVREQGVIADRIITTTHANQWLPEVDVLVIATSAKDTDELGADINLLPDGSVVFDAGRPKLVSDEATRPGLLVVDGGNGLFPKKSPGVLGGAERFLQMGGPKHTYGCLAETALMALQGSRRGCVSQSIGSDRSAALAERVGVDLKKHGFRLDGFRSNDVPIALERIREARECRKARLKQDRREQKRKRVAQLQKGLLAPRQDPI